MTEAEIRALIEAESQHIQEAAARLINARLANIQKAVNDLTDAVSALNIGIEALSERQEDIALKTDDQIHTLRYEMKDIVKEETLFITRAQVARIMREESNG